MPESGRRRTRLTTGTLDLNAAQPKRGAKLPPELKQLFWDYDAARLRWDRDKDLIIARILAQGDWHAAHWLVETLGKDNLREWLRSRKGRGLDARVLRFWEVALDLPHREVTEWLREQSHLPWQTRLRP